MDGIAAVFVLDFGHNWAPTKIQTLLTNFLKHGSLERKCTPYGLSVTQKSMTIYFFHLTNYQLACISSNSLYCLLKQLNIFWDELSRETNEDRKNNELVFYSSGTGMTSTISLRHFYGSRQLMSSSRTKLYVPSAVFKGFITVGLSNFTYEFSNKVWLETQNLKQTLCPILYPTQPAAMDKLVDKSSSFLAQACQLNFCRCYYIWECKCITDYQPFPWEYLLIYK